MDINGFAINNGYTGVRAEHGGWGRWWLVGDDGAETLLDLNTVCAAENGPGATAYNTDPNGEYPEYNWQCRPPQEALLPPSTPLYVDATGTVSHTPPLDKEFMGLPLVDPSLYNGDERIDPAPSPCPGAAPIGQRPDGSWICPGGEDMYAYDPLPPVVPACPTGYVRNTAGQCVLIANQITPPLPPLPLVCPSGYVKNTAGQCVLGMTTPVAGGNIDFRSLPIVGGMIDAEGKLFGFPPLAVIGAAIVGGFMLMSKK